MNGRLDDAILARRAAAGDRKAFCALLENHYGLIFRIGARVLGDAEEAQDLAQEVCVGLVTKLSSYGGKSQFRTWLYRVVVNAAYDRMRRNATRYRSEQEYANINFRMRAGNAVRSEDSLWLQQALGQLNEGLRATVALVLEEGLTHVEAGEVLGISEATVSWRLHEVRKRLRALWAQDEKVAR